MRRRPVVALIASVALAAAFATGARWGDAAEGPATWVGTQTWTMDDPRFGGMSAIEVAPDGNGFVALSDRGTIVPGTFRRDAAGRIAGIDAAVPIALRGRDGAVLASSWSDSEGLAIAPDGTIYVSFEIKPRVLRYASMSGPGTDLPVPRDFAGLPVNGALEALAIAPDGTLYTLPEQSVRRDGAFNVYRFRNGVWDRPFSLPQDGPFLPVGADFGPDGRLYLLERSFGTSGFATRVRRFAVFADSADAGELLLQTRPGTHGNLEGIGVWRDGSGGLRLTMIADDNFHFLLRTQIVEYVVQD